MGRSVGFNLIRWMKGMMLNHMSFMVTCHDIEDFIDDYLAGELPERQRMVFEFHLKICRECREYLAAYRRTMEVSKLAIHSDQPDMSGTMPDDLIRAIREARRS